MRNRFLLAVAVILAVLPGNLAWGQANLPNNPNAVTIQGPDPTGQQGYPLATVPALGALPWPVAIQSFAASLCVTQCTSPWTIAGTAPTGAAVSGNPVYVGGFSNAPSTLGQLRPLTVSLPSDTVPAGIQVLQVTPYLGNGLPLTPVSQLGDADTNGAHCVAFGNLLYNPNHPTFGATFERARTPSIFKTVATAANGNTALWTPAVNKKIRLMRWRYTITDNATLAAPGALTVTLFDGAAGVTGQADDAFVPGAALNTSGQLVTSPWIDLGNGYLSTAAGAVLNVNLSAPLTAGTVRVQVCGTEE